MKHLHHIAAIALSWILASIISIWWYTQADLLDTVFQPSKNLDQVINIGNSKNAVWNEVFRWSTETKLWSDGFALEQRDPLIIRITKTLLRITIALAIPMIIFTGVKTILSVLNGWDYKNELKNVITILAWLILALSAIGIIYLIQSITLQSLSWAPASL